MARATTVRGADVPEGGMEDLFRKCRIFKHAWDDFYPDDMGVPMFGWRLSLRCTRCGSERHDIIDSKGEVGSREYRYAEGYLKPGEGRFESAELRQELYKSIKGKLQASHAIGKKSAA